MKESPRVRRRLAARARARVGGKAAVRLRAFVEQRALDGIAGTGPQTRAPVPRAAPALAGTGASVEVSSYQRALADRPTPPPTPGAAPVWRSLGPTSIPNGQTNGRGRRSSPSVAGRVTAIGIDPSDGNHLLVGSGGGGVWETRDRGGTWEPRTDNQPSLAIGALAFDPSDPAKAYAGTGEGNLSELPGQGLLRSDDGGSTWSLTTAPEVVNTYFFCLLVDPTDGDRLFAGTSRGVLVSDNGGNKWRKTTLKALTWDLSPGRTVPPGPIELLAASENGLYRSRDRGATWRREHLPWGPKSFAGSFGRMAVRHAPSDPGVAYAFAALDDGVWLWRRERAGGYFSQIRLPSLDPPDGPSGYGISQAWYDWCLAVAPDDSDTIFLGAIEIFRGHRSSKGRWSWSNISSRSRGDSIHSDQHCLVFDPSDPNVLYAGNDGGIFRSPDRGRSWKSLNDGLVIAEFEYLAHHPRRRSWIIGGTQDNGTLRRRRRGATWDRVADGDGGDCAMDASSPDTCYHGFTYMAIERSTESGCGWEDISPPVPESYQCLFYPPLEARGSTIACAGESVLVSDDEGTNWQDIPLPEGGLATAMTFDSDDRILVGRQDGRIYSVRRTDGTWGKRRPIGQPRDAYLSDLIVQPSGRIWATYSAVGGGQVFASTDGGETWPDRSGDLPPDVPVSAVEADPLAEDRIWLATDLGVFQSLNGGVNWSEFGTGLPNALAVDLVFHAELRLLRVGTRSRGVWEIDVS